MCRKRMMRSARSSTTIAGAQPARSHIVSAYHPNNILREGIDRSLIRPCHVGSCSGGHVDHNRRSGPQAAGWYERREIRRGELLSRQIVVLSKSAPLSRITSPFWLGRAITSWPSGGWKSPEVYQGPVSSTGSSPRIDGFARLIIRERYPLSVRDTRPRLRTPGR